jgi:hypothetical protein
MGDDSRRGATAVEEERTRDRPRNGDAKGCLFLPKAALSIAERLSGEQPASRGT